MGTAVNVSAGQHDGWEERAGGRWTLVLGGKLAALVAFSPDGRYACWAAGNPGPSFRSLLAAQDACEGLIRTLADVGRGTMRSYPGAAR